MNNTHYETPTLDIIAFELEEDIALSGTWGPSTLCTEEIIEG